MTGQEKAASPVLWAHRRAALKGRVYGSLADAVESDCWETWLDAAESLNLADAVLSGVLAEVVDELNRRAVRLPSMPENTDSAVPS